MADRNKDPQRFLTFSDGERDFKAVRWTGKNLGTVLSMVEVKTGIRYDTKSKSLSVTTPTGRHFMPTGKWITRYTSPQGHEVVNIRDDRDMARIMPRKMADKFIDPFIVDDVMGEVK